METKIVQLQKYLKKYEYLKGLYRKGELDIPTTDALKKFKEAYLFENKKPDIDGTLLSFIAKTRCGVPDHFPEGSIRIFLESKFIPIGCSYFSILRRIGYKFINTTSDLSSAECKQAIQRAIQTWAQYIPIDFFEDNQSPVFKIGFYSGAHGDTSPFDGPSNVLAHAYYPPPCGGGFAGNMHFDEDEVWRINGSNFDLESVALHEIGHLLGLAHSSVPQSVMYAYYGGVRRSLTTDDINGIQSLYGKRSASSLSIVVHLQDYGDINGIDNEFIGTRKQYRRLEGFSINQTRAIPNLSFEYMAHLQGSGDTSWVSEGTFIGTRQQANRLEGFAIRLTGSAANDFNILYIGHLQDTGDTGLFSNGQFCGTRGQARRVEGILVRIEPK